MLCRAYLLKELVQLYNLGAGGAQICAIIYHEMRARELLQPRALLAHDGDYAARAADITTARARELALAVNIDDYVIAAIGAEAFFK